MHSLGMIRICLRKFSTKSSEMVRILNVAEKNDAAKSLSDIMSRGGYRKREGLSKYNKIYEYEYNLFDEHCKMTMTSVSGHLLNYDFTAAHKKWYSCSPVELFTAPVVKQCPQDYVNIKKTLEREARGCQTLILWTDCDREGENIGFEIVQVCKAVKPNLRILRARFSEITHGAISRAIANLIEPDKNVSDAVDVRQELDLRIGAAFTRFQTLRLQKVFPEVLNDSLISYGSCQFPTLGFVVERYKQVEAFIPEPFWKLRVLHKTDDGDVEFSWKRNRLFDHTACLVLYEHVIENATAEVTSVRSRPKSKWRPAALETVEMEKLGSRKLKINAKETMRIAEKLYTQGLISYPRTETNIFPKDLDLRGLVQKQTGDQQWGGFAAGILERGGPTPRNGNKSDKAHPPIHPIKYTNSLQGNEKKIYDFIVRHFLACCSQDAQGQETTVDIVINDEQFSASGLMIIARNYLDVYPYDKWTGRVIPVFQQGEMFIPEKIEMSQGATSPPSLLTEADLIALMDKHGIGTDATHADHIETIKSRLYVGVRDDGKIVPGELGMGLVEGYDAMGYQMSKPHLRSELEADLVRICEGSKSSVVVLDEQVRKYKDVFIQACDLAPRIDEALSQYFGPAQNYTGLDIRANAFAPVRPCAQCGERMVIKTKKSDGGFFLSCLGYPNCRSVVWFPSFVVAAEPVEQVCNSCQPGPVKMIKFKFKRGTVPAYMPEEYIACIGCDETLKELFRHESSARPMSQGRSTQNNNTARNTQNIPDSGYISSQSSWSDRSNGPSRGETTTPLASRSGMSNSTQDAHGSSPIICSCGGEAKLLTVRKEGPNTGRQFYTCAKPQGQGCSFFAWADPEQSSSSPDNSRSTPSWQRPSNPSNSGNRSFSSQSGGSLGGSDVRCPCGNPSKLLTVQKEGNNKGRQFHSCAKPRDQGCNFFQWADEAPDSDRTASYGNATNRNKSAPGTVKSGTTRKRKSPTCSACGEQGHTVRSCKNK